VGCGSGSSLALMNDEVEKTNLWAKSKKIHVKKFTDIENINKLIT
jgi:hypothetical protein